MASDYHLNVQMGSKDAKRVVQQERTWNGTRLVLFSVIFLAICLGILYLMSSTTSETTWTDWLLPWPQG